MPVSVYVPIRLRLGGARFQPRFDEIEDAVSVAALRALSRSRIAVLEPRRGYATVRCTPPSFIWSGEVARVSPAVREETERRVAAAVVQASKQAGLFETGAARVGASEVLPEDAFEPIDANRFDEALGLYEIPSYDGGKGKTKAVDVKDRDPFAKPSAAQMRSRAKAAKPPAPIDWDTLWVALRGPDRINRWSAFASIRDLVENGDKQAVTWALSAIRADGDMPTSDVLSALRTLARRHSAKFRRVLRSILAEQRATFGAEPVRRGADDFVVHSKYHGVLDVLGGLARVVAELPAARGIGAELEREAQGLSRIGALLSAVIEARRALDLYLTDHRPPTIVQLLTHVVFDVAPDVPEQADLGVVTMIRVTTAKLFRFIGLVLAGQNEPEKIFALQNDLVEHHRWITATLVGITRIDRALYSYRRLYGDVMDKLEEVTALRESRARYLTTIADHPFPVAAEVVRLRDEADAFAAGWYGRAASVKFGHWVGLERELKKAVEPLEAVDVVVPDTYNHRLMATLGRLASLQRRLSGFSALPLGPESLALMSDIDREFALLAIQVAFCQLGYAAHHLMRVFTDKSIGNDDDRADWRKQLGGICKELEQQFERPDVSRLQDNLQSWKESIERHQRTVQRTAEDEAWIKIGVILLVIVITAGIGAPEGVGLIVVTLGEAAIITAASLAVDIALDKPISLGGAALEFGENVLLFGALKILNARLFAIALGYPGRTLTRLAIIFGGNFVATTLPALVIQTIQTGDWPEHIGIFLAGCFTLNAIMAAFAAPRLIKVLQTMDRVKVAELYAAMERLELGRNAWLAEMNAVAKRGRLEPLEYAAFQQRGMSGYEEVKRVAEALLKFPDSILVEMGLTREGIANLAKEAGSLAAQIQRQVYEPQPGVKRLPSPGEVVSEGLVPTRGNTLEYNANAPGTQTALLVQRFRKAGYVVTEEAGVVRLLAPGEDVPRHLLLPSGPSIPAPALSRLVLAGERNIPRGLRLLQAQNAVPSLEATLTSIAVTDSAGVRELLEGMGRHFSPKTVNDPASTNAIKGIAHFLEIGGQRSTLTVAMGRGEHTSSAEILAALGRFTALDASGARDLDVIVRVLGRLRSGTDGIVGIGAHHPRPESIYSGIAEIEPYTTRGLEQLIRQLASDSPALRQEGLVTLQDARTLIAGGDFRLLEFSRQTVKGVQALRVRDVTPRTPHAVEKDIGQAIRSNVAGEDPTLNFTYHNKNLREITRDLEARRIGLVNSGRGNLLPPLNNSPLELDVTTFVRTLGSAELRTEFDALQNAPRGSPLAEAFADFLSHGRIGDRRPDNVEVRLGTGELEISDPTIKTNPAKVRVHEFKTRLYGEATQQIVGPNGPMVRSFEVNPALRRHIEFP